MIPVAIMGGSGYTGVELMRLIHGHPQLELTAVSSRQFAGQPVNRVFGAYVGNDDLCFCEPDPALLTKNAQLVFTAVPHQTAMAAVPDLLTAGASVVDLSADFRLRDQSVL